MPGEGKATGLGILSLTAAALMAVIGGLASLSPAGAQGTQPPAGKSFRVVTTFTVIQDIAQNVAGDAAIVESITKPGAEIHDYQPTPLDIVKAQAADLVLWNGMNLERWFEKFFENVKDVPSIVVTEGVEPMGIGEGPYTGKPNPHAWMSPSERADLRREHPQGAWSSTIPANAETYNSERRRLCRADQGRRRAAAQALRQHPGERSAGWSSSEGAFSYLARDYGLKRALPVADQRRRAGHAAAGARA